MPPSNWGKQNCFNKNDYIRMENKLKRKNVGNLEKIWCR